MAEVEISRVKPDLVTWLEVRVISGVPVMILLHAFLGFSHGGLCIVTSLVQVREEGLHVGVGRGGVGGGADARMSTSLEEEGGIARGRVETIVVRELGQSEPLRPVVLIAVAVNPEERFDFLVHSLGLAVGLRVPGRRRVMSDSKESEKFLRGVGHETGVSVRDELLRGSGIAKDVVSEESGEVYSRGLHGRRDETGFLRELVDSYEDCVVSVGLGQRADQVDGKNLSWGGRNVVGREGEFGGKARRLCLLAGGAAAYIAVDVSRASGPPVVPG